MMVSSTKSHYGFSIWGLIPLYLGSWTLYIRIRKCFLCVAVDVALCLSLCNTKSACFSTTFLGFTKQKPYIHLVCIEGIARQELDQASIRN